MTPIKKNTTLTIIFSGVSSNGKCVCVSLMGLSLGRLVVEQPNGDQPSGMDWPQQDRVKASGGVTHDLLQCIHKLTHLTIANGFSKETHLALVMNWVGNINSPVIKWTPDITDTTRHTVMYQTYTTLALLISREAYYYSNHWLRRLATQTH